VKKSKAKPEVAAETRRRHKALNFGILVALIACCFLFGGASRTDVKSLILLQPLAVVGAAIFLLDYGSIRWRAVKAPLLLLGGLAGIMVAQLIPLPPALWTHLPGHGQFAATASVAGIAQPWRPISLAPDFTLSSLVGLVVPAAVLIGYASLPVERTRDLVPVMIAGGGISALLGLAQLSGGANSPLYPYEVTSRGLPVGLFANRNHQALLLAMIWPMLAVWSSFRMEGEARTFLRWLAAAIAIFLLPMTLATGSRAGLLLGAVGLAAAYWLLRTPRPLGRPHKSWQKWLGAAGLAGGVLVFGAAVFLSRDEAVQRAAGLNLGDELRFEYMPSLLAIARDFFPVGAGFGSFDPLFRSYEPAHSLSPSYLNHAHNDLLEIVMDGGLAAVVLLLAFIAWLAQRARLALRKSDGRTSLALGRLALAQMIMFFISSLVDYPLRTPLLAAICAIACGWLGDLDFSRESRAAAAERDRLAGRKP
jgi:O-antigen ligase